MKKQLLLLLSLLLAWLGAVGASAHSYPDNDRPVKNTSNSDSRQAYYTVNVNNDPITASNSIYVYFYYDNLKDTRSYTYLVPTNGGKLNIECEYNDEVRITFDSSFADYRPTNTSHWFEGLTLSESGVEFNYLQYLNTSEVTDMSYMFYQTTASYLNLTHFDTSKASNMSYMLSEMDIIAGYDSNEINLSSFTFKSTTNTTGLLKNTFINKLTVPATANDLATDAFSGTASVSQPCTLICPNDFSPEGATQVNGYIQWKGGYFKKVEAYAVLDGSMLKFYYDYLKASRTGTVYDLNTENNTPGWNSNSKSVTTVEFDASFANARPTSCYRWFYGLSNLTTITGIENLKTDAVTNMGSMFYGCSGLTNLNVSNFNTDNVTDMQRMFHNCSKLTSLDVSRFNTANVTYMRFMFSSCASLTNLDVSNFNTANVTDMRSMFQLCKNLTSLDVSSFTFNDGKVTDNFLYSCSGLKTLTLPASANNLATDAFSEVASAENPCVLYYPADFTPDGTERYSGYLIWKGGYFKDPSEAYAVFEGTTLTFYYDQNMSSRSGKVYELNTENNWPDWRKNTSSVTNVVFDPSFANARPTSCCYWFDQMSSLTSITGIEYLKTDEVTNMSKMFRSCIELTSLDLSGFNTAKVTVMDDMFYECSKLESLDLSRFDTSNVTDMSEMFRWCNALTNIDLSGFITANVTNMSSMFSGCSSLTSLDVSSFNTANVTNMGSMFYNCSGLTSLDVSDFNTANVTNMSQMFRFCSKLETLDLSGFSLNSISDEEKLDALMTNCYSLKKLVIPASAALIKDNACKGVGKQSAPCMLVYPSSFTPEKTSEGDGWYVWKGGYFTDGIPGDANSDGTVTVADVMLTVSKAMNKPLSSFNERNADINHDGKISVADVMGIVKIVINGSRSSAPSNAYQSVSDAMAVTSP